MAIRSGDFTDMSLFDITVILGICGIATGIAMGITIIIKIWRMKD